MLDSTHDAGTQLAKLAEATNEVIKLTEMLKVAGQYYNESKILVLKATPENRTQAKIERQEAEGKYKEILASIRCQKEIINTIKTLAKAEHNQF
jgi:hypothetical protein